MTNHAFDNVPGSLLQVLADGPRAFRLIGELDVSVTGRVAEMLAPDLATPGDLTLDLSGVEFMDSAGIHLFIKTATSLTGNLRLLDPGSNVARVIETTGLERLPNLVVVHGDGHLPT